MFQAGFGYDPLFRKEEKGREEKEGKRKEGGRKEGYRRGGEGGEREKGGEGRGREGKGRRKEGTEEMAPQLRALATLPEDLSLAPNTHVECSELHETPFPGDLTPSSGLPVHLYSYRCIYT